MAFTHTVEDHLQFGTCAPLTVRQSVERNRIHLRARQLRDDRTASIAVVAGPSTRIHCQPNTGPPSGAVAGARQLLDRNVPLDARNAAQLFGDDGGLESTTGFGVA